MADAELLSEEYAEYLIPSTIIQLILGTFGVLGNGLVLLMYTKYIQDNTGCRYFIPILAIVDLLGSFSNVTQFHFDNTMRYIYPGVFLCKTMTFLIVLTNGLSTHLILAIALQRYRLICRPFGKQLTPKVCRIVIFVIFWISIGYAAPIFKFKTISYHIKSLNVTGDVSFCHIDDGTNNSSAIIAYLGSLLLISFINIFITSGLYIPVIKTVYKRLPHAERYRPNNIQDSSSHDVSTEIEMVSVGKVTIEQNSLSTDEENRNASKKRKGPEHNSRSNISVMFFVIIIVYVVSYMTSLVTHIYDFASTGEIKGYKRNIYVLSIRFQLINHIANPYIYWFYDFKFREELRRVFCRIN
ncbi:thyrotropin-releasing hormone receptor-like [Saccostrea cucullata]|uniref:thyrotropin-releasing hormone receptor-like n=1 Tax=Saccostrea cuccullata TaxID=36930 RepID=UPI002ED0136C